MHSGKLLIGIGATFLVGCTTREALIDFDVACRPRTVVVNHAADRIQVDDGYIDVCSGYRVTILVVPPVPAGAARSRSSSGNPPGSEWLTRESTTGGRIEIDVPNGTALRTYKYALIIDGVGSLDPYIRVIM